MSVPIRRRRRLRCQMRFTARLHFVWSYYGEHLGLRIPLVVRLLQVLLFLLPAAAVAAATATAAAAALPLSALPQPYQLVRRQSLQRLGL